MGAEQVIFITGTGRSGTNILKKILGTNDRVATLPFEHRFTVDPRGILDFYNTFPSMWSPYWADFKLKDLEEFLLNLAQQSAAKAERASKAKLQDPSGLHVTPPPYSGWELEEWIPGYGDAVKSLIEALREFEYSAVWPGAKEGVKNHQMYFSPARSKSDLQPALSQFLASCHDAICRHQGRNIFVEDNTHSILFASDLLELVPNGKIIHVTREPADVISSLMHQRWAPSPFDQALAWYGSVMSKWHVEKVKCDPAKVLTIPFEQLIGQTDQTLATISAFIDGGVSFNAEQINLERHNIGRGKNELQKDQLAAIESAVRSLP